MRLCLCVPVQLTSELGSIFINFGGVESVKFDFVILGFGATCGAIAIFSIAFVGVSLGTLSSTHLTGNSPSDCAFLRALSKYLLHNNFEAYNFKFKSRIVSFSLITANPNLGDAKIPKISAPIAIRTA